MKLSVVVAAFDERATIAEVIRRVQAVDVGLDKEIIVVDDGSADGPRTILQALPFPELKLALHGKNRGKGAALRTGFAKAGGDTVLAQDADLEKDPGEAARRREPSVAAGP